MDDLRFDCTMSLSNDMLFDCAMSLSDNTLQAWFGCGSSAKLIIYKNSVEEFPEIGSPQFIYVDKSTFAAYLWDEDNHTYKSFTASVTGVKGDAETVYRSGNVNITKENIGLGNVDNTADIDKPVSSPQAQAIKQAVDTYVHNQRAAESIWEVQHNLDRYPSVSIVDSAGTVVYGDVKYIDENNLTVIFNFAFSGKAYLN